MRSSVKGLIKTPSRAAKAFRDITSGYTSDLDQILNRAFFKVNYKEMVIIKDITFNSLCEHHLLPFFGKAHIAYIPDGRIIGLSKIPRLVNVFARRLQVQERLTAQIADTLYEKLKPKGVGVVLEAKHLCMTMRGVENETSFAVTSSMLGSFEKDNKTREEFLNLIKNKVK
ncbi:MAG: GTP cyclohydrolase I FolE [Elusimicrobia bacterium]|nr:GTP cyclohydrolase I FolE [Elusimicrobiota bacterium]